MAAMPLDGRQAHEILLTAAQSLLAIVILANWSFGVWEGVLLFALFSLQLLIPVAWVRLGFSILYLAIALGYLFIKPYRTSVWKLLRTGWRVSRH